MKAINEVKMLAAKNGVSLTYLAKCLSEKTGKDYSLDKLSKKLRAETIRYTEMQLIAQALGMKLVFEDNKKSE